MGHTEPVSTAVDEVYPSDPMRLLASVPELELFLSDRRVRGGIERARPHDVYRALYWARVFGRFKAHRETLDMLLADRRLFVAPMQGAPWMFTYNGIGLSVYGEAERKSDDAYIGTQFVVGIFVPLFPVASFLMASAGGNSYRFFGRVPLSPMTWFWNRLIVLGAVASVVAGLNASLVSSRHADITVVNGLPSPVVASVCGHQLRLTAHGRGSITVPVGHCSLEARSLGGSIIEALPFEARPGRDLTAWNIAGAAPLYRETVVYGPAPAPEPDVYCGQNLVVLNDVDYVFTRPPESISSRRSSSERRTHVDVADTSDLFCLFELVNSGRQEAGVSMARAIITGSDFDPSITVMTARNLGAIDAHIEAAELLGAARTRHPNDLDIHLEYQAEMLMLGRQAEALTEYRTLAETSGEGWAHYLAARLDDSAGVVERSRALAARFPGESRLVSLLATSECSAGNFSEGLQAFERLVSLAPELASERVDERVECLAALGRRDEALQLVETIFRESEGFSIVRLAALHHDLSALPPRADSTLHGQLRAEDQAMWPAMYAGLAREDLSDDELEALESPLPRNVVEVLVNARANPARAIEQTAALASGARSFLPSQLYVLLVGEAARLGADATDALVARAPAGPELAAAWVAYVRTGVESDVVRSSPRAERAALAFVRSRTLSASDEERAAARQQARELDSIPGWIPAAEEGWPAP